ncbi:hypothetical protein BDV96DRAFT_646344 [Lophiotrema nucula]|uniref:Uncharacterized protein n=1 Tax=Lophiotrema nucula TaxID=690887 RepID=A0A6A5Z7R6_9PLEO|nr:hypothetical protein BDV96DRAFT_646344 [Lophiotrema nucula]
MQLLQLSGEVRNKIYEFSLSTDAVLYLLRVGNRYSVSETFYGELTTSATEFNQLKYVCRQLHRETARLEARFNDVTILDADSVSTCLYFFTSSSHRNLALLNTIVLRYPEPREHVVEIPCSAYHLALLTDLCRSNPKVQVKLKIPTFGFSSKLRPNHIARNFIYIGVYLDWALRGKDSFYLLEGSDSRHVEEYYKEDADDWRGLVQMEAFQAPNLSFWPSEQQYVQGHFDDIDVEDKKEKWSASARKWIVEGITSA